MWDRVRRAGIALACGQGLALAEQLFLMPLFLVFWSPETYGKWLSFSALAGLIALFDFGMSTGTATRLTQLHSQGEEALYRIGRDSTLAFYLCVAAAGTFCLTVALFFIPWNPPERWTLWLLGLQFFWAMPHDFLGATYRTVGNLAATQWAVNARRIVEMAIVALALAGGASMRTVAGIELTVLAFSALVVRWHCRRRCPVGIPGIQNASFSGFRGMLRPSLPFWTMNWVQVLGQNLPILLIRARVGEVAVAVLAISRTFAMTLKQGIAIAHNALWPEVTRLEARGEKERLQILHRQMLLVSSACSIAAVGVLWFVGEPLLHLWTRRQLPSDPVLLRLWLSYVVLQIPWVTSSIFLQATNQAASLSRSLMLSVLVGLLFCALLVGPLKSWSIPLGLALGETLFCLPSVTSKVCRIVEEPAGSFSRWFWKGWAVVFSGTLAAGWAAERLAAPWGVGRWVLLAFCVPCVTVAVSRLAWRFPMAKTAGQP